MGQNEQDRRIRAAQALRANLLRRKAASRAGLEPPPGPEARGPEALSSESLSSESPDSEPPHPAQEEN